MIQKEKFKSVDAQEVLKSSAFTDYLDEDLIKELIDFISKKSGPEEEVTVEVSIGWNYNTVIKVTIHTTPKLVGYFKDSKSFREKGDQALDNGDIDNKEANWADKI